MYEFGVNVGMAFLIKDDIFDFGSSKEIGKPTGIDIKERKMTLPLIYTLNKVDRKDKNRIINTFKNHNEDPERVQEVIQLVIDNGGIEYSEIKMNQYKEMALKSIEIIGESEAKKSLISLLEYSISRNK